eukprot:13237684-Alexandrium_andersonii.AAC.1
MMGRTPRCLRPAASAAAPPDVVPPRPRPTATPRQAPKPSAATIGTYTRASDEGPAGYGSKVSRAPSSVGGRA